MPKEKAEPEDAPAAATETAIAAETAAPAPEPPTERDFRAITAGGAGLHTVRAATLEDARIQIDIFMHRPGNFDFLRQWEEGGRKVV